MAGQQGSASMRTQPLKLVLWKVARDSALHSLPPASTLIFESDWAAASRARGQVLVIRGGRWEMGWRGWLWVSILGHEGQLT